MSNTKVSAIQARHAAGQTAGQTYVCFANTDDNSDPILFVWIKKKCNMSMFNGKKKDRLRGL